MATDRYWVCSTCEHRQGAAGRLFDNLRDIVQGKKARCSECGKSSHLELTFGFGLSSPHRGKVLDAFLPKPLSKWPHGKSTVEFYPFLVIVKSIDEGYRSVWLPYWHVVTNHRGHPRVKYGQWAPFIWDRRLASLVGQAKAKGYKI